MSRRRRGSSIAWPETNDSRSLQRLELQSKARSACDRSED